MFHFSTCLLFSTSLWASVAYIDGFPEINEKECQMTRTMKFNYVNWYALDRQSPANASDDESDDDVVLKFYVQGKDNAHIRLAPTQSSFGYDIVLGAGDNTYSDLRKYNSMDDYTQVFTDDTVGVLDASRPMGFWIRVSNQSGQIEVGRAEEEFPFILWTDPEPISVKYFSFSSWHSSACKWLFRCKFDESVVKAMATSKKLEKFLTSTERLRKHVLKQRNKFGLGNPMSNSMEMLHVGIASFFRFIHLDVMTSTLTVQGQALFKWTDDYIYWNPRDYSNISKLHLSNNELWRPELVLHNALDPTASLFSESKISVDNTGRVMWNPKFDIQTKCNVNLKSWPWDRHFCTLTMSPWSHKISNIIYEMIELNKSKCFFEAHSDWKLDKMTTYYVPDDQTPWDDVIATVGNDENYDLKRLSMQLVMEISRNTKILEKLFYVPLLLISGLWLSSFCMMSNLSSKITLICVSIILSTLIVVYMMTYVPVFAEFPPDLLFGYLKLMLMMSTDAFVSSCLISYHRRKTTWGHPPLALARLLTTPVVTRFLVLPRLDYSSPADHEDNNRVNDDYDDEHEIRVRSTAAVITLWDVVIVAFERLVFVTYFVITLIVLSSVRIFVKSS